MNFSESVWELCKKIPNGKVSTYSELAMAAAGNSKACRAVGNALNKNPFSPVVPCHRVVKSNGSIGGFARGSEEKIRMLKSEGIEIKNNKIADFEKVCFRFQ